ncbi:MAG: SAM-dependent methyltransferase, partial [Planctomycetota bacterium]
SQIATFVQAFPETTVWSSDPTGKGYDVVLMARLAPSPIDVDALGARIAANAPLAEMLAEAGLGGAIPLLRTYAGRGTELQPWLADAELNLDVNLRLQYLAGLRLDVREDTSIFADMKRFWRYPDDLFVGSAATLRELRRVLER